VTNDEVGTRDAPRALGAVEARRLRRANRLVAQLGVADAAGEHREQQRTRDAERDELVMRQDGRSGRDPSSRRCRRDGGFEGDCGISGGGGRDGNGEISEDVASSRVPSPA